MPRKLSKHEQELVPALSKRLARILPRDQRAGICGIASSLVRLAPEPQERQTLLTMLERYEADERALDALIEATVLAVEADGHLTIAPERALKTDSQPEEQAEETAQPAHEAQPAPQAAAAPTQAEAGTNRGASAPASPAPAPKEQGPADSAPAAKPEPARKGTGASKPKHLAQTGPKTLAKQRKNPFGNLACVRKQTPELNDIRRKIIDLDPRLWINGWLLSTPEAYTRFERELLAIDRMLAGRPTLGDGTLTLRELSYRIFGDEKYLAPEAEGHKLLYRMGIADLVQARRQPRFELMHHIPKRKRHLRVVVSENLDPWMGMRRALFEEDRKRIMGERVHGIVFGDGSRVVDPHALPDLLDAMAAEDVEVLYWGDIDRAGFETLARLDRVLPARFNLKPFAAAYRIMIHRARLRWPDPLDNEATDQVKIDIAGVELLEPYLDGEDLAYLEAVLEGARIIPQEIIAGAEL